MRPINMYLARTFLIAAILGCDRTSDVQPVQTPRPIARIQIVGLGSNTAAPTGHSYNLSVAAYDAAGSRVDVTSVPVAWATSDSTIARVDQSGLLQSVKDGSVEVYARVRSGDSVLADSVHVLYTTIKLP